MSSLLYSWPIIYSLYTYSLWTPRLWFAYGLLTVYVFPSVHPSYGWSVHGVGINCGNSDFCNHGCSTIGHVSVTIWTTDYDPRNPDVRNDSWCKLQMWPPNGDLLTPEHWPRGRIRVKNTWAESEQQAEGIVELREVRLNVNLNTTFVHLSSFL